MKKVYQTDTSVELGNCVQACIASIMHLSLRQVPKFKSLNPDHPVYPMLEYLTSRGYSIVQVRPGGLYDVTTKTLCLAAVESKTHKGRYHMIVGQTDEMGQVRVLHDPNKENGRKTGKVLTWIRLYFIFSGSQVIH